jgi:hypothetical protein
MGWPTADDPGSMLEQQFRRVIGYTDLSKLVIAIECRHPTLESPNPAQDTEEVTTDTVTTESAAQLLTV